MNAMITIGFIAAIFYGILVDGTFFKIYFVLLAIYTIGFKMLFIDSSHYNKRKNMNVTSWNGNRYFSNLNSAL
jgi:undecaprenyl pyrophosphate phosphatase UppP